MKAVNGHGFQMVIDAAIEIGATYGKCSVETFMPDCTTISRNTIRMANESKKIERIG